MACLVLVLWGSERRTGGFGEFVVLIVPLAMQRALSHAFVYWDALSDGLPERRLWNTREIAWREVQHVGGWRPSLPSSDSPAIDFARPAPLSDRGSIIAHPEDREEFIAALRRLAPQAAFGV